MRRWSAAASSFAVSGLYEQPRLAVGRPPRARRPRGMRPPEDPRPSPPVRRREGPPMRSGGRTRPRRRGAEEHPGARPPGELGSTGPGPGSPPPGRSGPVLRRRSWPRTSRPEDRRAPGSSVRKSFGACSRPTARISGRSRSAGLARGAPATSTAFGITIVRSRAQVRAASPGSALMLRNADRHGRQRLDQPVGPAIEAGLDAGVRSEGPAVHGEDPDRNTGEDGGEATEHAGLRAAGMKDVRSLTSQQARQLDETGEVTPRADRAADIPQRKEANTGGFGGLAERARIRAPRPPRRSEGRAPGAAKRRRSAPRRPRPA